jgi:hypothetical protein
MIEPNGGKFYLICDVCGSEKGPFKDFQEATADEGWVKQKEKWGWGNYCPECYQKLLFKYGGK